MGLNLLKRTFNFTARNYFVEVKLLKERDFFYDKSKNKCHNAVHIGPVESHEDGMEAYNAIFGRLSISWAKLGQNKKTKKVVDIGKPPLIIET